jgi:hypothetical protein
MAGKNKKKVKNRQNFLNFFWIIGSFFMILRVQ